MIHSKLAREAVLKKIAKKAGLIFYYRGNCSLCHVQARTISLLSMEYGFELIPISTDGHPIPELPNSLGFEHATELLQ
ncbi:conjugal transfer protein TraF [Endozoicomonas gorgoniicola]|uniref:Conjugal transfer protein TraF n=1 Tax=Endozoicomonas gorgoniicola TaxID=1234144 RepID=A0ABT3MVD7_9GAMM|nr:conjugal transfer protein TraF [Endozoicomonas gorgoniicola]MCW7553332.1 conjugal transfer protein TraF [Endozoicomonas gorgoniicola]